MLEQLYQELILDHYKTPRHRGPVQPFDVHVHHSNPLCGDELDLWLAVDPDDPSKLSVVGYDGDGCSISMASASAMTEAIHERSLEDALDLSEAFLDLMHSRPLRREEDLLDAVAFTGVQKFPVRVKCALLGWMALRDAIAQVHAGNRTNTVTYDEAGDVTHE